MHNSGNYPGIRGERNEISNQYLRFGAFRLSLS